MKSVWRFLDWSVIEFTVGVDEFESLVDDLFVVVVMIININNEDATEFAGNESNIPSTVFAVGTEPFTYGVRVTAGAGVIKPGLTRW